MNIALLAASCGDDAAGIDPGLDAGTGTDADTDTDADGDCECDSFYDSHCEDDCLMEICDGCSFTETDCCYGDPYGQCDPEVLPNCSSTEVEPECLFESDDYCADELTLMECQIFEDVWDNYFEETDCYDPLNCPCGSGCAGDDVNEAACWCCADAGVDGGADGGV
jgi:hypothetical protein